METKNAKSSLKAFNLKFEWLGKKNFRYLRMKNRLSTSQIDIISFKVRILGFYDCCRLTVADQNSKRGNKIKTNATTMFNVVGFLYTHNTANSQHTKVKHPWASHMSACKQTSTREYDKSLLMVVCVRAQYESKQSERECN